HLHNRTDQRDVDVRGSRYTGGNGVKRGGTVGRYRDFWSAECTGIYLPGKISDRRSTIVKLRQEAEGVGRVHPAAIHPVALDVELTIVRIVQRVHRGIRIERLRGNREERIAARLTRRRPP